MNAVDLDDMTLLDDATREATTAEDDTLGYCARREGRRRATSSVKAKPERLFQTTGCSRGGTESVSPKLRDAILALNRDDALRRAYVRRCWMDIGRPGRPASRT